MKIKQVVFSILILLIGSCYAQNTEQLILDEAERAFQEGNYYTAANGYARLLNEGSNVPLNISYKYAESLRMYNSYPEAAHWYQFVFEHDSSNSYPNCLYWLALMTKQTGNYDLASEYFSQSLNKNISSEFLEKAKLEVDACKKAKWIIQDTLPVKIEHLGTNINTPYSEFGAIQLSDTALYFSSLRMIVSDELESILPGVFVSKIFYSKMSVAGLSNAKTITEVINDPKTNNGNISFSEDKSKLYFTRCESSNSNNSKLKCEIWVSEKVKNKWDKPTRLTHRINLPGTTTTQPCYVSGDDNDILYFASDRPNGFGGMDIWYSIVKQGKYADPVNLGSNINTIGDEITPFYHKTDSTLYFSTNTQPGIGGFDIFSSHGGLNQWTQPKNIGVPFNSVANDIYFSINEVDNDGYFTSNRAGSFFIKGETCCNDIYSYEWDKNIVTQQFQQDTIFMDTIDIQQHINDILPLTLYFHNDEPDPATTKTTTDKNYKTTLANYFALKEIYNSEYTKGLVGNEAIKAGKDIDDFFNNSVKKGFTDLEQFAKWLLLDLEQGNSVKITIKGYTSPLHTAEYNMKLAMRRISSLKNYIYDYRNGIFNTYLNGKAPNGAKLELLDAPIGKTEADSLVSDNPNDKRNSIYSKAAALERRIQIILYQSEKTNISMDSLPKISLPTTQINFGKISKNENKTITIQFKNSGKADLRIDSIQISSPSILSNFSLASITKQKTGFISFQVKVNEYSKPIECEAIIFSNAINRQVKIKIKSQVE